MTLGLVCDACDGLSPATATSCIKCHASLGILPARTIVEPPRSAKPDSTPVTPSAPPAGSSPPAASSAKGARLCPHCGDEIATQHRFCGSCGKPVTAPANAPADQAPVSENGRPATLFFGAMQAPRPKLVLIRGEGQDGVSYVLSADEHLAGRSDGAIQFPDDPFLSPRHANFIYRDKQLFVRDEGSVNGVFVRMIKPQLVLSGATLLIGEQLLRIDSTPAEGPPVPDGDGTFYYASPRRPARLAITQLLAGGAAGMIFRGRSDTLTIGREGNDINFPEDPFISGRHATVQVLETPTGQRFSVTDLGSKNGTFLRAREETPLLHGDYVFIGQQLLRVELT